MRRGRILPALLHERLEHVDFFVIDKVHMLDAKPAHFLLSEILALSAAARAAGTSARSAGSARSAAFAALSPSASRMAFRAAGWAAGMPLRAVSGTRWCIMRWCWWSRLIRHLVSFPYRNRIAGRPLFGGGCGNLLLRLRRCRRRPGRLLARAAAGAALAMLAEFLLALELFVKANGLILDDGIRNFQPPLEFLDQVALRAFHDHVNEKAFAVFGHAVRGDAACPIARFFRSCHRVPRWNVRGWPRSCSPLPQGWQVGR